MKTIAEIQARLAAIATEIDTAEGDALTALEEESRGLLEQLDKMKKDAQARKQLLDEIAAGAGTPLPGGTTTAKPSEEERAAKEFAQTRHMTMGAEQARATLVSSGKLATPTEVDGINEIPGAKVSSIIDLVHIENCVGMGTHRVAYTAADADEADVQTEGAAAGEKALGSFDYVDIKPTSVAVIDYISKQAKKQTPLQYAAKVRNQALIALRKKAATILTTALKESALVKEIPGKEGVVGEVVLTLQYGGDESVIGGAILFLNKADLLAFGDVRGTNEKKAVYEITPDTANPNTGVIKDGGLTVRYCINSKLTAMSGAAEGAGRTMFYGAPKCAELDLFSDYEINVSSDFAINKLMDTIVGDVELGAGVIVKDGFVALTV